jgi:hypothetical protein
MESNLFITNDLLKQEIELLKSQIVSLKEQLVSCEKTIQQKEEESAQKIANTKNYAKTYFQEKTKNRTRYCECCKIDVKNSSYCNHIKSKVHLLNVEKLKN